MLSVLHQQQQPSTGRKAESALLMIVWRLRTGHNAQSAPMVVGKGGGNLEPSEAVDRKLLYVHS